MEKMTRQEAEKIVAQLSAMTQKDMVKAMSEDEEFRRLHDELLANGWATLTEGLEKRKDGKIVCAMRLVRGDDPEWLRIKPTEMLGTRKSDPDRWRLFTVEHWCKMLNRCHVLAEKCPADMLRRVKAELRRREAAARKTRNEELDLGIPIEELDDEEEPKPRPDPRTDAKRMTGADWVSFLIQNQQEWKLCDFSKLSGRDWVRLICVRRRFYVLCNWELLTLDDWCALLTVRPGFAKLFEKEEIE